MAEIKRKKQSSKNIEEITETEKNDIEISETSPEETIINSDVNEVSEEIKPEEIEQPVMKVGIIGAPKISVVIPFLAKAAQGNELLYALRSMEKNFREDFQVIIIGDRPDWISKEVIHIEHQCISKNPQVDVIDKIKTIIGSDLVNDKFIWTNDDIYFVSPVSHADIATLKIVGDLKDMPKSATIYGTNREKTISLLEYEKLPTLNFATRLPVEFEKEKIVQLFEQFSQLQEGGFLFSSVYFNRFFNDWKPILLDWTKDNWMLRVISKNPDPAKFRHFVNMSKFLNNSENGYSDFITKYLETKFPGKSKFEI